MVLPPDFSAPSKHLAHRFPPLGPAVVQASVESLGLRLRAVDLVIECRREPLVHDPSALEDPDRVRAYLGGARDLDLDAVLDELCRRIERVAGREELVAISVDRGSQTSLVAALSVVLKRRWGARLIVGGVSMPNLRALLERSGAHGPDIVTTASSPAQIERAFALLEELPAGRVGPALEPNDELVQLVRGGMRAAPSAEGWPLPDFSIYDLDSYRRDPLDADADDLPPRNALGASLVLPYFFSFECQFSCAFCQTGGSQEAKSPDLVVRELGALSERWGVGEFLFFDTQINLHAEALSRALIDARLDLRWSDSFRVRPLAPGVLELMARAGCASITVGVESASERVLKAMVKGHRPEHASEMVREAHAAEMLLRVNLLTCYPGETDRELAETVDWVRAHASVIDDLAPSSFYLTRDSPIGRRPERYGIIVRGARPLSGPTRFRKSPDSLEYDEVDGYTWEEREPMLAESEARMHAAWREGREGQRLVGNLGPAMMLTLRRKFAHKEEAYAFLSSLGPSDGNKSDAGAVAGLGVGERAHDQRAEMFTATLIAPKDAALERVLTLAFDGALAQLSPRLAPKAVAHVLLFHDGSSLFFRGAVTRDTSDRARMITFEEHLSPIEGAAAGDARAALVEVGASVDLARARCLLGSVAVLTFRVGTRGAGGQS